MSTPVLRPLGALVIAVAMTSGCSLASKLKGQDPTAAAAAPAPAAAITGAPEAGGSSGPAEPVAAAETERVAGLPKELVALVREAYGDDPDRVDYVIGVRNNYYDELKPAVEAFTKAWAAYRARAVVVEAAVAKARELEQKGDLDGARAALAAVITHATADANGRLDPRARTTLDPRDAEVPAIDAWVRVAAAQKDRRALVEAGRHYFIRRKVRSEEVERWFWLAASHDATLGRLVSQNTPGIRADVWKLHEEAARVRGASPYDTEGMRSSAMYQNSLAQYGLEWTVPDVEKGKKGDWIMIKVDDPTWANKAVRHASTQQWRVPKRCWDSKNVSWWDSQGRPVYERECEYTYHSRPITLAATLVDAAPAWATARERVLVVGRIESPGPTWKLADAFVPDLRYYETDY